MFHWCYIKNPRTSLRVLKDILLTKMQMYIKVIGVDL